jgi:Anthranilate/para-aminobenzoate synthases component I
VRHPTARTGPASCSSTRCSPSITCSTESLIIANARITPDEDLESLYQFACAKIQFLERELERNLSHKRAEAADGLTFTSNHTRERFEEQVRAAKEHIAAGDIYQVVLSQRFEAESPPSPSRSTAPCAM